jgi:VacB/RNase II family 3'-5' exoribonuclease
VGAIVSDLLKKGNIGYSDRVKNRKIVGTITTIRKGMGFVADPTDEENDIVIESDKLNFALNGDEVEVLVLNEKEHQGQVVKVITRARESFVGTVEVREGKTGIIPDDKKMYVDVMLLGNEATKVDVGDKVQFKLGTWKDAQKNPEGIVLRVIGKKGNNNVEMESIVLERGFEVGFPAEVEKEADVIEKNKVKDIESEIPKRRDFRQTLTVTIDPFDAKDFDDAISFKDMGNGTYEVGVHIADVSHYVKEGTALDREAFKRGCSIYLVDRTIPMLPEPVDIER